MLGTVAVRLAGNSVSRVWRQSHGGTQLTTGANVLGLAKRSDASQVVRFHGSLLSLYVAVVAELRVTSCGR